MARVRNNQGYRKKTLDVFLLDHTLEQENTQERESYLARERNYKTSTR